MSEFMSRIIVFALGLTLVAPPAWADNEMQQSPLLMRRAGPSCQPGNLEGDYYAGYRYQLGPCAGPDRSAAPDTGEERRAPRHRRRF